jgi:regulator of replication initiation timing
MSGQDQVPQLQGQVAIITIKLKAALDERDALRSEVERLRGRLRQLQWAGTYCKRDREMAACPVCDVVADSEVVGQLPHAADCWLWKEIRNG